MLPESIDDVLESVALGDPRVALLSDACTALQRWTPTLVVIARAEGTILRADDFGGELDPAFISELIRTTATQLREQTTSVTPVETPAGPRLLVAVRLPQAVAPLFVACLVDGAAAEAPVSDATAGVLVCAAVTWTTVRAGIRAADLSARVEQLTAAADTIRERYSQSLANALEEHEQRLREQEASQLELRRLHACNKLILDSAGEGIIGMDAQGRVVFANPAVERMVGWKADEMLGQHLAALVCGSARTGQPLSQDEWPVNRTLQLGTTERLEDGIFWRKDGTTVPVEYVATPIQEDHHIVGAVVTFRDITHRKLLECQLVQAQKLESIGQLAAGIAHEINTPTQFIGDNLRFLHDAFVDLEPLLATRQASQMAACAADSSSPHDRQLADIEYLLDEIPKAIGQSLEGVEHVANIVRSMKEFSHPDNDEMQPTDLNKALESTLTICRNEWKYCAEVVTDFDPALPLVNCLPGACNQVFLNLLVNAAHAIAERNSDTGASKGTITVRTRVDHDWVEVCVADTGTGIPDQFHTRVFDPFFTTKEVGKGSGQGLAIARSVVVDRHGGTLSFETELGRGTTFIVRLPWTHELLEAS